VGKGTLYVNSPQEETVPGRVDRVMRRMRERSTTASGDRRSAETDRTAIRNSSPLADQTAVRRAHDPGAGTVSRTAETDLTSRRERNLIGGASLSRLDPPTAGSAKSRSNGSPTSFGDLLLSGTIFTILPRRRKVDRGAGGGIIDTSSGGHPHRSENVVTGYVSGPIARVPRFVIRRRSGP